MLKTFESQKRPHIIKVRKMQYIGETIYPNGRHAVELINKRVNATWGGVPIELNISDVVFLFDDHLRVINRMERSL